MGTYDGLNFKSKPEWLSNEHGLLLAEIRHIQKELQEIKRLLGAKPHPLSAVWKEPKQNIEERLRDMFVCNDCNERGNPSVLRPGLCIACANKKRGKTHVV